MEDKPSRGNLKRPFLDVEDDDSDKTPAQKRVRFPKGKKVKPGEEKVDILRIDDDGPSDQQDPRLAARERAMHRTQINAEIFSDENRGLANDVSAAEVHYEDNETFVDDGIQIEPFNLLKEREEGYFDAEGNYVEYISDKEIKDVWLDSVEVDPKLAGKMSMLTNNEDDIPDLTSQDIGKIKRRIADALEPGETVLQALRRLKGTSNNKEKMSAETKALFDQLTEDAMRLMENGDYDVYEEKQEVFQREAEGYERLALASGQGTSMVSGLGKSDSILAEDFASNGMDTSRTSALSDTTVGVGPSNLNNSTAHVFANNGDDAYDMFGDDDENATANPASTASHLVPSLNPDSISQPSESGTVHYDYAYDESSGYYYSSSLGYYYDPSSGLYCSAASGQWYSYNEETGTYDEIQSALDASV